MDEFLAVAKLLEIKELCNAEADTNDEPEEEPLSTDPETLKENLKEQKIASDHSRERPPQERRREVVSVNGKYECEPCLKTFTTKLGLHYHIQSVHQGLKYACNQCDYQATQQSSLTIHIKAKHEGIKYYCNQCNYQAGQRSNLTVHIQSKHEGVRYACDQCDYQATTKKGLTTHFKSKHEWVKYA